MTENTMQTIEQTSPATGQQEETRQAERYVTPAVDIYEEDSGLVVVADMPGLPSDAIDISTEKSLLRIKGTAPQQADRDWAYQEFAPLSYYREFRLGTKIDQQKISADYRNGVLTLKLPFAEEVKPRKVEIKVT